eukprot:SAG22_NODE_136_length_18095_cov_19.897255_19_plen_86_part_00
MLWSWPIEQTAGMTISNGGGASVLGAWAPTYYTQALGVRAGGNMLQHYNVMSCIDVRWHCARVVLCSLLVGWLVGLSVGRSVGLI